MKQYPPDELEFYLPQMLSLFIQDPVYYTPLQFFLLDMCATNMHFALLVRTAPPAPWAVPLERLSSPRAAHFLHCASPSSRRRHGC